MWKTIRPPGNDDLNAVWGRSADDVFVAGPDGIMLRTRDRGKAWTRIAGLGSSDLYAIIGVGKKTLLVGANTGERTFLGQDGPGMPPRYKIPNQGVIFRSDDDGETFTAERPDTGFVEGFAVHGTDIIALTCGAVTSRTPGATLDRHAAFLHSTDLGKTWTPETIPLTLNEGIIATYADGRACGVVEVIAADDGFLASTGTGTIYRRTKGAWSRLPASSDFEGDSLGPIYWDGAGAYYAGMYGGIRRSTDGGKTWPMLTNRCPIVAFWGSSPRDIYAVGGGDTPTILHTTDGGETWVSETIPGTTGDIRAVWGSGGDVYAVGEWGVILKRQ